MTTTALTAQDVEVRQGIMCRRASIGRAFYLIAPIQETGKLEALLQQIARTPGPLPPLYRELIPQLHPSLQDIVFPEVATLRREKKDNPTLIMDPCHLLRRRIAKLEAALFLDIHPQPNERGRMNSLIYRDIHHKALGIFKLEGSGAHAEFAAYQVDVYFGIGLTPPTCWRERKGEEGSFMTWASPNKYVPATALLQVPVLPPPTKVELDLFQRMAIFDLFIGNLDRHSANWLIQQDKDHHITDIRTIDHGSAFSTLQECSIQMYLWRAVPLAAYIFTEKSRELLAQFTPENVAEVIRRIQKVCPNFLTPHRIAGLEKRASILQRCATQPKRCPLHLLPNQLLQDPRTSPNTAKLQVRMNLWARSLAAEARRGSLYDSLVTDRDIQKWAQNQPH